MWSHIGRFLTAKDSTGVIDDGFPAFSRIEDQTGSGRVPLSVRRPDLDAERQATVAEIIAAPNDEQAMVR